VYRFRSSFLVDLQTLHHSAGTVAENLFMIRGCAVLAETEGTCPGNARAVGGANHLIWWQTVD
jgi:hypothetical protein